MKRRFDKAGTAPDIIIEQWPPYLGDIYATLRLEDEWATKSVDNLGKLLHYTDAS